MASTAGEMKTYTYQQITEAQVKDLLQKLKKPEDARKFLQEAGLIDEDGQLAEPYRPIPQEPFPTKKDILKLAEEHGFFQDQKTVDFVRAALTLWG